MEELVHTKRIRWSRLVLAGLVTASSLACEAPPTDGETVASAVLDSTDSPMLGPYLVKEYNDCRGAVRSAIWLCFSRDARQFHRVTCPIGDASYVAVGGAAEISDASGSYPGAFLVDSQVPVPFNPAGYAWDRYRAASKSHIQPHAHSLYTYVIGLKIVGLPRQQIVDNLQVHRVSTAGPNGAPEIWSQVPSNRVLLSASANLNWGSSSGVGQVLAGLWAGGTGGWGVQTRSIGQYYSASLDGYAISLPSSIGGFNLIGIESQTSGHTNSGTKDLSFTAPRAAITHIGGWDYGTARGMQAIAPVLDGGWTVRARSKDHVQPGAGAVYLGATGIGQPYQNLCAPPL